jgi:hypothetical protein
VLLDFGDELLWQLQRYDSEGLRCVKVITKRDWVGEHGGDPDAVPEPTGASPLLLRGAFQGTGDDLQRP